MAEWKPIASLNGKYEASSDGEIRNAITGKVLRQFRNRFGYMTLTVRPAPNCQENIRVHRAVAEAFYGACPGGKVVNHKDGNKQNNAVANLEYVTSRDNNIHALRTGLRNPAVMKGRASHGEAHCRAAITEADAKLIRKLRESTGYGPRKLGKMTGISRGIISGILYRDNWKF